MKDIASKFGGDGHFGVALYYPKSPENVGGVLRASCIFGADYVVIKKGIAMTRQHKIDKRLEKICTDVHDAWKYVPVFMSDTDDQLREHLPYGTELVAVEKMEGAQDLADFVHPERALYVFGPEEASLSKEFVRGCDHSVWVPMDLCINLAASVNIVLYDRTSKERTKAARVADSC